MDAHVCSYMGQKGTHICYNDAAPIEQAGHSAGVVRFFDNTYTQVATDFGAAGDLRGPDIHELNTPDWESGETFLQDIYEKRAINLTEYDGPEDGYILDGCFQEIEIATKSVAFQWCALEHIPIWHTYTYLQHDGQKNYTTPITANGSYNGPWDWMHFNAVSKNEEGDYVISARHHNTIYKIAGKNNNMGLTPGEIMWRLGGKFSDFKMDFNFSRQHTVKFVSTSKEETVISFYNNAYDGLAYTARYSEGQLVTLNNKTMVATLTQSYPDPLEELSVSQGSVQLQDNGNVVVSWGNRARFSEFTKAGKLLYHAKFLGGVESFRVWKFPWKGYPKWAPKLLAYAHNASAPLHAYVSWNGATEVKAWRFHVSESTSHGPWKTLATVPKSGFETFVNFTALTAFQASSNGRLERITAYPYMYATALDSAGYTLAHTAVTHAFIPNATISKKKCNETACHDLKWFEYDASWSIGHTVQRNHSAGIWALLLFIAAIELIAWVAVEWGWGNVMVMSQRLRGRGGSEGAREWDGAEKLPFFSRGAADEDEDEDEGKLQGKVSYLKARPVIDRTPSGPSVQSGAGAPVKVSGMDV